jgi:hypothetical protein
MPSLTAPESGERREWAYDWADRSGEAADAEVVGVLAVRRGGKQARAGHWTSLLTPAQRHALSELARGLFKPPGKPARKGGASQWGECRLNCARTPPRKCFQFAERLPLEGDTPSDAGDLVRRMESRL